MANCATSSPRTTPRDCTRQLPPHDGIDRLELSRPAASNTGCGCPVVGARDRRSRVTEAAGARSLAEWETSKTRYPRLSVIVLNYRRPLDTIACFDSVAAASYPGTIELIVVENGSGDDSTAQLRAALRRLALESQLVENAENLGFAGGVISGWERASGDLICLLNNDAVLHAECLTRMVDHLRGRADLGALWPWDAPREWARTNRELTVDEIAALRHGTHSVIGNNIWIPLLRTPTECFTASGVCLMLVPEPATPPFLAEHFAYYEDVFLGWRLRLQALGSERVPTATIYHEGSLTGKTNPTLRPQLAFHAEKNRLLNMLLLYSANSIFRLLPLVILDEVKKVAVFALDVLRGRFGKAGEYARTNLRARWWILRNLFWLSNQRKQIQSRRRARDEQIFPLMSARLTMDHTTSGRWLNRVSLAYCRAIGIRTVETDA